MYYIFYILYRCEQKWRKFSEVKSFSANAWTTLKLFLCKFFGPGQFSVRSKNMNLKNLWPILKEMLIPFPRTWHFYWVLVEKQFYVSMFKFDHYLKDFLWKLLWVDGGLSTQNFPILTVLLFKFMVWFCLTRRSQRHYISVTPAWGKNLNELVEC